MTDGTDVPAVTRLGRTILARLRTALEELQPECVIAGCHVDRHLEIDHNLPFADGGPTAAWNLNRLCHHHHDIAGGSWAFGRSFTFGAYCQVEIGRFAVNDDTSNRVNRMNRAGGGNAVTVIRLVMTALVVGLGIAALASGRTIVGVLLLGIAACRIALTIATRRRRADFLRRSPNLANR